MKESFDEVVEKIKNCKSVAIFGHINTDGDCLGCMTALYNFLLSQSKNADMFLDSIVPEEYKILPSIEKLNEKTEVVKENYDLFVSVDCSTPDRLGVFNNVFLEKENTLLIDHHLKYNGDYAKTGYVVEMASSCGEVLFDVLKNAGKIDNVCATCLFNAVLSDTNSFTNSDVSSQTFQTAASLVELGADFIKINYYTQKLKTKKQMKLLGYMASHLKIFDDVAMLVMSKRKIKSLGVKGSDVSKFLQDINNVEGVKITILAKQIGKNEYRVSFRSLSKYNVSLIALCYGGGGHKNASGCTFKGTRCKLIKEIVLASKNEIKRAENE